MAEQPFTEEDIQLAEAGLRKWFHSDVDGYAHKGHAAKAEECAHCGEAAEQAVRVLAEAGRLLPPRAHTQEDEEFAVFQQTSGGYNVSKFVDVVGHDTETRAKEWAEEFGGEVKQRQVTTVYGPWVPVGTEETPDAA